MVFFWCFSLNQEHFRLLRIFLDSPWIGGRLTKRKRLKTVQLTWDGLLVGGIANSLFRQAPKGGELWGPSRFWVVNLTPKGLTKSQPTAVGPETLQVGTNDLRFNSEPTGTGAIRFFWGWLEKGQGQVPGFLGDMHPFFGSPKRNECPLKNGLVTIDCQGIFVRFPGSFRWNKPLLGCFSSEAIGV